MYNRWLILDSNCDPAAPFAITYLSMTQAVKKALRNNYFDRNPEMVQFTLNFAKRYQEAINPWMAGNVNDPKITQPWKEAFNFGATNQSSVTQDVMLGISVSNQTFRNFP